MKIRVKYPFYSGGHKHKRGDGRIIGGHLYEVGEHEVDAELAESFPKKNYVVVDKDGKEYTVSKDEHISQYDTERWAAEAEVEIHNKVQAEGEDRGPDGMGPVKRGKGRPPKFEPNEPTK